MSVRPSRPLQGGGGDACPIRQSVLMQSVLMRGVIAILLAGLVLPPAARAVDSGIVDSGIVDSDQAFRAAVELWNRSPSPAIEVLLDRALALRRAAVPENDPSLAPIYDRIGRNAFNGGDFTRAEAMFATAVRVFEPAAGAHDLELAAYLGNLGAALREQGRFGEAWNAVCRSLAIRQESLPLAPGAIAGSLDNLARIAAAERQYPKARVLAERSHAIAVTLVVPTDPFLVRQNAFLAELRARAPDPLPEVDPCSGPLVS